MADIVSFSSQSSNWLEWLVAFRNPKDVATDNWSFFICEILFCICGILTLIHATRLGGRYFYLWLATFIHGITVEVVSYLMPDIDNFWHAQSTVMLIGKRLPLHITFLYPTFLYTASVSVYRLRLPFWSEPFAVGLTTLLLDIPFDIIGIKNLWWSWHDTDPNLEDRSYFVPWVSYLFHPSFAAALTAVIKSWRKLLTGTSAVETYRSGDGCKEVTCAILSGILGMPLGVLFFIVCYHIPHDAFLVHTEVCVATYLIISMLLLWGADRNPSIGARTGKLIIDEILMVVLALYVTFLGIAYLSKPEVNLSEGMHETVGSCYETKEVITPIGMVLKKGAYLCLKDYDELYFDFHCIASSELPTDGTSWYTICGTPHTNFAEYFMVVSSACIVGLCFFFNVLVKSGNDLVQSPFKIKRY